MHYHRYRRRRHRQRRRCNCYRYRRYRRHHTCRYPGSHPIIKLTSDKCQKTSENVKICRDDMQELYTRGEPFASNENLDHPRTYA